MRSFLRSPVLLALLSVLLLAGCAQNTVRLVYTPSTENTIPLSGSPAVSVVAFTDKRVSPPVGQRSNGSDFMPSSSVSDWITHSLASELSQQGLVVTLADSEAQAQASGAKYMVTGSIDEIWLTEKSSTDYDARMRATVTVKEAKKNLLTRSFSSALSRRVVPLSSVPEEMLSETLRDLVTPMARAINEQVRR